MISWRMVPVLTLIFLAMATVLSLLLLLLPGTQGGFETPDRAALSRTLFGSPCDCKGGMLSVRPASYTRSVDCTTKMAYLAYRHTITGTSKQSWECVTKPRVIPAIGDQPGLCPSGCVYLQALHSTCYDSVQRCTGPQDQPLPTAIQQRDYAGTFGGEWGSDPHSSKYAQAPCDRNNVGKTVCWPLQAPIHLSDGGGPTDQVRESRVSARVEEIIKSLYPSLHYHTLALPKPRGTDLDVHTSEILAATLRALNHTNPDLAASCWLCMTLGTPMPLALVSENASLSENCTLSPPFRVQPVSLDSLPPPCTQAPFQNSSFDIDVGRAPFVNCSVTVNLSSSAMRCPRPGQVFVCGGNQAFTALPQNWTGLCVQASLLPDIDIISGTEPVPLPSLDYIAGRSKRAVVLIPLLVGLGVTGALATGSAGLGVALDSYRKLSTQLISDVQTLSETIHDLQDQIDSLAEVVLQNRRGLDLLTAEQGGICLALQEKCCFYANKSGIVRDKIRKLQEDLVKRRRELFENPLWSGLRGVLPYLLPLLGPLFGFLLLLSFGPWAFNKLTSFVKSQIESSLRTPVGVHYHRLDSQDDPVDSLEDGFRLSTLAQPDSRCARMWRSFQEKCHLTAVRRPMTGILRPHGRPQARLQSHPMTGIERGRQGQAAAGPPRLA
ncbi:syncytin-1-like [Tachyglossus aculeatus]|uniref:syncytin-1-like n=1 Tax=Tachyglossus aculeatus TaxID=9261 RepID=UPI0018F673AB|nr:syncytin-1-like [Tachyglossus aculeatus]